MTAQINIFHAEIDNAESAFRQYLEFKIKEVFRRSEPNLFSSIQGNHIDFKNLNEEISYKMRVFEQIVSVRNQVKLLQDKIHQRDSLLKLNSIIIDAVSTIDGPIELINPYINIIENEIHQSPIFNTAQHILIVYNPNDEDVILNLVTVDDKEIAALKICKLLVEAVNDDWCLLDDLDAFITPRSIEFLKSIQVPIQKHIDYYNQSVIKGRISNLLQRSWDVYYKIVFKITDVEKVLLEDEVLSKLIDDQDCYIFEHSVEFHLNSENDFTGEDINPLIKGHLKTLKEKLDSSVYDNLSCDYDNEIIQRLLVLCENPDDLVKLSSKTSFPHTEEIENLHDDMLNYIQ
jgi:hypothetical protein